MNDENAAPLLFWSWDTGIGDTSVGNNAWLSEHAFCICTDVVPFCSAKELHFPLEAIRELRFSRRARILEIYYHATNPAVVWGRKSNVHREVYDALRSAIARDQMPEDGVIQARNSINTPATALVLTLAIGGILLLMLAFNRPEWLTISAAIFGGVASVCVGLMVFRLFRPHRAEIIVINGSSRMDQREPPENDGGRF